MIHDANVFQSTRPRGARPCQMRIRLRQWMRFNPRARAGRDRVVCSYVHGFNQFQSTRPRGARLACLRAIMGP